MNPSNRVRLAYGAIVGQIVFVGGWVILGALEGHGYRWTRDYISDLGAPTAQHVVLNAITLAVCGVTTAAFALGALRPALAAAGRRAVIASWLIALSVLVVDNISDVFFRL